MNFYISKDMEIDEEEDSSSYITIVGYRKKSDCRNY